MIEKGVPWEDDKLNPSTVVLSFPMKSPAGSPTTEDLDALYQLQHWCMVQDEWCEHKPSITVFYRDSEYLDVGAWVWSHFDRVSGVSFLPFSDHTYTQAPYEKIDKEEYEKLLAAMPEISLDMMPKEEDDNVVGVKTLACSAGVCEL
jgi:ribonucleoside-diphosphate reductase alpha chain